MTHIDEEAAASAVEVRADEGHGGEAEAHIHYPPQRGQETLHRLGPWLASRFRPLAQPEAIATLVVVGVCVGFVFWQFQPSQLFKGTTISGGDTGAHVLLPWVAMHELLPDLRLTGWTSSNWDGFPAVTFYFPLPVYSIVVLSKIIFSYNIAFKLATAAPMIFMPVAGWLMGRLARAPFPIPAVLAVATLPYIFGQEYEIYGGNILSTLAGEFAFAWGLWFALVFLGLVMRGLQTGRCRALAAVALACCFMSHIDPAMFAGAGAIVLIVLYALRNRDWVGAFWWAAPTLVVGGLLAAWWALPFYARFPYVTDMGYGRITTFISTLFPASDTWLFILAGVGAALSLSRRRRIGEFFTIVALLSALAFRYMPQSILWNARVLPFWFLSLYVLGALAVAEMYAMVAERATGFLVTLRTSLLPGPLVVLVLALLWVGFPLRILPGEKANAAGQVQFLGIPQKSESPIPSWVTWNYSGYQAGCRPGDPSACSKTRWPEYQKVVAELEAASKQYGCGNVMWEYNSTMNDYGTPDALTILPYWTNGCIGSMEGLYYEASATTPFHFINQSELSLQPSDPMVFPDALSPYASVPDVALGVQHLQMLGVKYYMAINTELQNQAAADPALKLISTFGPFPVNYASTNSGGPTGLQEQYWKLYLVLGAPRVHPLADQPVVMSGLNNASQPKWLQVMVPWYNDPSDWDVYLAATGPSDWKRVDYGTANPPVTPEPSTAVSDIVEHNASISFNVSRVGVPVVVTISYFPNWQVSGAKGVYRVSPNLMVVVPTSHHVRLWYGTTPIDYSGWVFTILAVAGLIVLVRRPQAALAAVRRPGLGQNAASGLIESAVRQRAKTFWAPKEPPTWPNQTDRLYGAASDHNGFQADVGDQGGPSGGTPEQTPGPEEAGFMPGSPSASPSAVRDGFSGRASANGFTDEAAVEEPVPEVAPGSTGAPVQSPQGPAQEGGQAAPPVELAAPPVEQVPPPAQEGGAAAEAWRWGRAQGLEGRQGAEEDASALHPGGVPEDEPKSGPTSPGPDDASGPSFGTGS